MTIFFREGDRDDSDIDPQDVLRIERFRWTRLASSIEQIIFWVGFGGADRLTADTIRELDTLLAQVDKPLPLLRSALDRAHLAHVEALDAARPSTSSDPADAGEPHSRRPRMRML